jgi:hypothetical protein
VTGWIARHGTYAGYGAHARADERPCDACYRAKERYDARRRAAPAHVRACRLRARAQHAALGRLRALNPELYRRFYEEEKRRLEDEST